MTDKQTPETATDEPTPEIKLIIIKQEMQPYLNGRYALETRLRVVAGMVEKGFLKEEDKKSTLDDLIRTQAYIDGYATIITELEAEIKALPPAPDNGTAGDSAAAQGDIVNESNPQVTKEKKEGK